MIEHSKNFRGNLPDKTKSRKMKFDEDRSVRPDGLSVRRMRHDRGWSSREMVNAVAAACERATGLRETITPNVLKAIEEHNETISYATLCLIADGFGCDPVDILPAPGSEDEESVAN